jgi:hypothetical protein
MAAGADILENAKARANAGAIVSFVSFIVRFLD